MNIVAYILLVIATLLCMALTHAEGMTKGKEQMCRSVSGCADILVTSNNECLCISLKQVTR